MKKKVIILILTILSVVVTFCVCFNLLNDETILIPVLSGDRWGYVNNKGQFVINPQFKEAYGFSDGLAKIEDINDNTIGYINKKGEMVVPAKYVSGTHFSEGKAFVISSGNSPSCIDKNGKVLFTLQNAKYAYPFSEGLAKIGVLDKNGRVLWGFCDKNGTMIINAQFNDALSFSEGYAAVKKEGKWGFIDKHGKLVINPQFDAVQSFSEGLACFNNGKQFGFIDKKGKYAINPQFDFVFSFSDGMAVFLNGNKFGVINKDGKIVLNPQFDFVLDFFKNTAPYLQNHQFGFIDKKGHVVINPQFEMIDFYNGKIASVRSAGKWGLVNKNGEYIINPQFEAMRSPIEYLDVNECFSDDYDGYYNDVMVAVLEDLDIDDLLDMLINCALLGIDDSYVESDFYDASAFIKKFLEKGNVSSFDGFSANSTLQTVVDHDVYGDYAQCYGNGFSFSDIANSIASCRNYSHQYTQDISLVGVDFFFNSPIYISENEESPQYRFEEKIGGIVYYFNLVRDAALHDKAIMLQVKEKIASKYNVSFKKVDFCPEEHDMCEMACSKNLCFAIQETYCEHAEAGINLYVAFSEDALKTFKNRECSRHVSY